MSVLKCSAIDSLAIFSGGYLGIITLNILKLICKQFSPEKQNVLNHSMYILSSGIRINEIML